MKNHKKLTGVKLWSEKFGTITADNNLDMVMGSVKNLPVKYWKPGYYFIGARDKTLFNLTKGIFPAKLVHHKTHPVFTLKPLPENKGFKVCPCSSKKPFNQSKYRYIRKQCILLHTENIMDVNSYIIEKISFNIPSSIAYKLRFFGEVPQACIVNS